MSLYFELWAIYVLVWSQDEHLIILWHSWIWISTQMWGLWWLRWIDVSQADWFALNSCSHFKEGVAQAKIQSLLKMNPFTFSILLLCLDKHSSSYPNWIPFKGFIDTHPHLACHFRLLKSCFIFWLSQLGKWTALSCNSRNTPDIKNSSKSSLLELTMNFKSSRIFHHPYLRGAWLWTRVLLIK